AFSAEAGTPRRVHKVPVARNWRRRRRLLICLSCGIDPSPTALVSEQHYAETVHAVRPVLDGSRYLIENYRGRGGRQSRSFCVRRNARKHRASDLTRLREPVVRIRLPPAARPSQRYLPWRRSCTCPGSSAAPQQADHPLRYINRLVSANKRRSPNLTAAVDDQSRSLIASSLDDGSYP